MNNIKTWLNDSKYISPLSPGCKMCAKGSKMVLLVTGMCPSNCFYCPLSLEKLNKDCIFADEWKLENEDDTQKLLLESKYIDAEGAGITGGDPFIVWKRTKRYIEFLKDSFGSNFHIHLYTSGIKNAGYIDDLVSAGLDEIRFHPMPNYWENMEKSPVKNSIKNSLKTDADVAIEIPVITSMKNQIIKLINWASKQKINWVNLNELEFSETNAENLISKKYDVKDDISSAVKDSEKTAYDILEYFKQKDLDIGIHYCSSSFKDGVQLRNRIKRRAKNISKKYETITNDGTLLKGIIVPGSEFTINKISAILKDKYKIKNEEMYINKKESRVELSVKKVKEISIDLKGLNVECYIIENYPTADGLEVERIPIN